MASNSSILLVEAHTPIIAAHKEALRAAGYQIRVANSISGARKAFTAHRIDLIILDVLLPDGSGLEFCRSVREDNPVPILFLTALAEPSQKAAGLRAGGDDYLAKPYHLEELQARIDALLRRTALTHMAPFPADPKCVYGSLLLDTIKYHAYVSGRRIPLAPREFRLVWYLAERRGQVTSPDDLYAHVWGEPPLNATAILRVYINALRKKLCLSEESSLGLENEYGKGYRLVVRDSIRVADRIS